VGNTPVRNATAAAWSALVLVAPFPEAVSVRWVSANQTRTIKRVPGDGVRTGIQTLPGQLALNERWSSRRVLIKNRQGELAAKFQRDHGRPPTLVKAVHLAQQATLETRDAKHEPRTLAQQRTAWHTQAAETQTALLSALPSLGLLWRVWQPN
jgi:hypothetical protein